MTARNDKQVTIGVLLAGGGSRRAGVDKRFLVLEGQTLLQRNLAFLHGLFPPSSSRWGRASGSTWATLPGSARPWS